MQQRVALAVIARSPIERLVAFKSERGWRSLKLYSDASGEFSRDDQALTPEDADAPAFSMFTRRDGSIRHFWGEKMGAGSADPGQDPSGAGISCRYGPAGMRHRNDAETTATRALSTVAD